VLAWSQAKPDFTGTWKLDPLRSRSEQVAQPKELVLKIEHQEPNVRLEILRDTGNGDETEVFELKTEGNPIQPDTATASARWDERNGDRLIIRIERRTPTGPVTMTREIRAGDKGKILTTILTAKDATGEKKAYEFYVRD
jgi:hypothetical protein